MKRTFTNSILLIIVVLTFCAVTQAQTHTTIRHHRELVDNTPPEIAQAEDAIQKNDFTSAETLLKKALDKDPSKSQAWSYQAWFDLGFVLNRLARPDESIAAYRKSVAAKPDVFESNLNLGLMLVRANNPDAEQFLRAATTLKPTAYPEEGKARAWLALAHLLENTKPEDAFQAYKKASELTPKDLEPHLSAGLLLERQKKYLDAEAEYKQAMALDPRSTEAAIGLTNLYMKSGHMGDAEPLLRRLAGEHPDDSGIRLQLGRVLAAEGKKDDAIAEIQIALKLAPADADAQRDLADLYAITKKYALAETAYRALITTHPKDAELHHELGKAFLLQKKYPEAQEEFLTTLRLKRDWADAYIDLAFAANGNNNFELTVRALNGRSLLNPDANTEMPPLCFFLRAIAYDHLRDYVQAALDYHHFLDVANGKYPDQEWQSRHRLVAIEPKKR
jgi:Tfp pilus assembly protein PilF